MIFGWRYCALTSLLLAGIALPTGPAKPCADDFAAVNRLTVILGALHSSAQMLGEGTGGDHRAALFLQTHLTPSPDRAMAFLRDYTLIVKKRIPARLARYLVTIENWKTGTPYPFDRGESEALITLIGEYTDWIKGMPSGLDRES